LLIDFHLFILTIQIKPANFFICFKSLKLKEFKLNNIFFLQKFNRWSFAMIGITRKKFIHGIGKCDFGF